MMCWGSLKATCRTNCSCASNNKAKTKTEIIRSGVGGRTPMGSWDPIQPILLSSHSKLSSTASMTMSTLTLSSVGGSRPSSEPRKVEFSAPAWNPRKVGNNLKDRPSRNRIWNNCCPSWKDYSSPAILMSSSWDPNPKPENLTRTRKRKWWRVCPWRKEPSTIGNSRSNATGRNCHWERPSLCKLIRILFLSFSAPTEIKKSLAKIKNSELPKPYLIRFFGQMLIKASTLLGMLIKKWDSLKSVLLKCKNLNPKRIASSISKRVILLSGTETKKLTSFDSICAMSLIVNIS